MLNSYPEIVRLVIAIIAAVAAIFYIVRINDDWVRLSLGWKVTRIGFLLLILVFGYGCIELMLVEPPVPLGLRVYAASIALLTVLVGLWLVRNEDANEGWIRASEVQSILDEVEAAHSGACMPPAPGCVIARDRMKASIKRSRKKVATG